jgi:uncharacterized Zn finger protein
VKPSFASLLNESSLLRLAGDRSYARGRKYFTDGAVVRLVCKGESISSTVQGSFDYRVKLQMKGNGLHFNCDCPVGMDEAFCKHCVATALTWLARSESGEADAADATIDLRTCLAQQEKQTLVDMLLELAEEDELLEQRLQMLAAKNGSKTTVIASFRKAIDAAIVRRRFVEYSDMRSYVRGIKAVADSMQTLIGDGHALEVRELAEHALKALEKALHDVDDSDGGLRGVASQFEDLHHSACTIARPDPAPLAKFLFDWEMDGEWDIFYNVIGTYADVLGKAGLAAYRVLAESEWEKVRPISLGEETADRFGRRFRIGSIMERFAEATGDIDALVAIKKKDLRSAVAYLNIAEIYKGAGRLEEAVQWAERGVAQFPEHAGGLNDFLIAEYHARGRHEEAIVLAWVKFEAAPGLDTYKGLKKSADWLVLWDDWRKWALDFLRESVIGQNPGKRPYIQWHYHEGHSILVDILLWEKKFQDAWNEATKGGCSKELWLKLARHRSKTHPADAVEVYLRYVEPTIRLAINPAYHDAVQLLGEVKRLKTQLGRPEEFAALVMKVRHQHKAKRNLMKLLQSEGW